MTRASTADNDDLHRRKCLERAEYRRDRELRAAKKSRNEKLRGAWRLDRPFTDREAADGEPFTAWNHGAWLPEYESHIRDRQRITERFEREVGEIALEFVQEAMPIAWGRAAWLWEAFQRWHAVGPDTEGAKNRVRVTREMAKGLYGTPTLSKIRRRWVDRARRKVKDPLALEDAVSSYHFFLPICRRLKRFAREFRGEQQGSLLKEWVINGERPRQIDWDGTIEFSDQAVTRVDFHQALKAMEISPEDLGRDFGVLRGVFGAKRQGVKTPSGERRYEYRYPAPDYAGTDELGKFLGRLHNERPGRLAATLAARLWRVAVRDLEKHISATS